jgi:protein TonB
MTDAIAGEDLLPRQWAPALWASLCLHLVLVGALQPSPAPTENRFSQRAIEVTLERAVPPPAPPAALAMAESADRASAAGTSAGEKSMQVTAVEKEMSTLPLPDLAERPQLEEAVIPSQPAPAVDPRDLALAALATALRPPEQVPHQPPQQKAIKPPAAALSASANQHQALQDYVLQVVRKLSQTRFYAVSPSAQNGHGVVIARLTVARDGGLIDLSLSKRSGSAGVDGSVLEAIRTAAPFAPLPKSFAENRFTFIVPINFAPEQ